MLIYLTPFVQQSIFLGHALNFLNCHCDVSFKSSKYDLEFIFLLNHFYRRGQKTGMVIFLEFFLLFFSKRVAGSEIKL